MGKPNSPGAAELRERLRNKNPGASAVIGELFDEGSFAELSAYVKRGDGDGFESVVTGYGAVDGRLVFAFIQDSENGKGAFTASHALKIRALYENALKANAPVVGIYSGAGSKITEGVEVMSGWGEVIRCISSAKNRIPQLAVITGVCSGCAAAAAATADFTFIDKENGILSVNSAFILNNKLGVSGAGSAEYAAENGTAQFVSPSDMIFADVRRLLNTIPSNCDEGTVFSVTSSDPNRPTDELEEIMSGSYDVRKVINVYSDTSEALEVSSDYGKGVFTGFMSLNGRVIGVVATDPSHKGGALGADECKKAASHIDFCGRFRIPVLTLVDTVGTEASADAEKNGYAAALSSLAGTYASCKAPLVTVITGSAVGAAFTVLGSKAVGADVVFAADRSFVSVMNPDSAVEFLYRDKINAASDPKAEREKLKEEWLAGEASPVNAARAGAIDDIISYDELRARVASAFEMLAFKA